MHTVWFSNESEQLRWFETDVISFESEFCQEVVVTKRTVSNKLKGAQKKVRSGWSNEGRLRGWGSSPYSCTQWFTLNFSLCQVIHQQSANSQFR